MRAVVIVGGGISGLAAAYRLRRLAPALQITLLEHEQRLGGKILTEQLAGCLVEGGPDSFLSRKPAAVRLCEELGITDRLQAQNLRNRKTYVLRAGQLYRLPEGLTGMVPTNLEALGQSGLISSQGQQRLAQEPALPPLPAADDESIASFVSRRLGEEVYHYLVEPLMGGIYAGDAALLSLAATFPQLRELERKHGSLLRGLVEAQPAAPGWAAAYAPFLSFRGGMQELVEQLLARLAGVQLRLGVTVQALAAADAGYRLALGDGTALQAQAVILTTPAYVTAALLESLDPALAEAHSGIPYASVATISLGFAEQDLPRPLDGFGYVIPKIEGSAVLACTWSSSKWEGRAPPGLALVRLYLGRWGSDVLQRSDGELLELALAELRRTLDISATPRLQRIFRWPAAMPQYLLGHQQRLAAIEQRLAWHPGLYLAGAAYRGVGIPDCISGGDQAARAAAAHLGAV